MLRDAGFVFAVATNQSGVPRGLVDVRNLDEIHRRIQADFARAGVDILSFHSAPYMTTIDHPLRKPNPGMLLEAARWHNLDPHQSWMVGEKSTDVFAGHRAGMRTAFLSAEADWTERSSPEQPEIIASQLLEVAHAILKHGDRGSKT